MMVILLLVRKKRVDVNHRSDLFFCHSFFLSMVLPPERGMERATSIWQDVPFKIATALFI